MGALGFSLSPGGVRGQRGFDFSGGVMPAGATLTRASGATVVDPGGVMRTVAADVARFDHDSVTGRLLGLLVEPARTNWMPGAIPAVERAANLPNMAAVTGVRDPAGGTSAARLTVVQSDPYIQTVEPMVPVATGGRDMCFSTCTRVVAGNGPSLMYFPIANGQGVTAFAGIDAGWRRTGMTFRFTGGDAVGLIARMDFQSEAGDAATGAQFETAFWQVEEGVRPTSYIPVGGDGAAVSRAADVLVLDWAQLGVADGAVTVRYGFDDGSSVAVATVVAGGRATVPTTLPRFALRSAAIA